METAKEASSPRARAIAWLLPPHVLRSPQSLRQARIVLAICASAAVVEPLFALKHFWVNESPGAGWVTLALAVAAMVVPLLVRRGLSTAVAVQIMCVLVVGAGAGVCLSRGSFLVTPLMGHVFLPFAGVLVDRRVVVVRWSVIGAVHLSLLALATRLGLFGLAPSSSNEYPQLLFFVIASAVLAVAYDQGRRELERDRARLQEQVANQQRLEALGQLAAGVAHDFNNLLTVVRSSAGAMLDELPPGHALRTDAEAVEEAVARGVAITLRLLSFARHEQAQTQVFDARETIEHMRSLLKHALPCGVDLTLDLGATAAWIDGDPRELERVLLNLVVNARDAMPDGGDIVVTLRSEPMASGAGASSPRNMVVASVGDTGTGIPSEVLPHVFEPFFTTKPRGSGTGLGLSSAWGVIKAMGGDIRVHTSPGGSRFDLRIPEAPPGVRAPPTIISAPLPNADAPSTPPPPPPPLAPLLLLVDDQAPVLRATKRLLKREGYRVVEAESGEAALALLAASTEPINLLVTDVVMPGMGGVALVAAFRDRYPGIPVLYISGHFDEEGVRADLAAGRARLLGKPFSRDGLVAIVAEALASASSATSGAIGAVDGGVRSAM